MAKFSDRLQHAWNAFMNKDPTNEDPFFNASYSYQNFPYLGPGNGIRPDRVRLSRGNERSIITSVYNRIAVDVASIKVQHVKLDQNGRYIETIKSSLNECLTTEANIDQTGRALLKDAIMSMFDEGAIAIAPIDTSFDPNDKDQSYKIFSLRVAKIVEWFPKHVKLSAYDERSGQRKEFIMAKTAAAIIENPFYSIMNEPNSTLQRLIRKLNLLDVIDEQSGSGKLDLIIQLPYVIKTEARREQAEQRRKDIEMQLAGSKYGIAYTDGTEHITQLNRAVDNNLMTQIEYLTNLLYSQLGITTSILDGTADEKAMTNYYDRTVEPLISAITDEMYRKFLTKTARSQNQSIQFFRDPFKLVPVSQIAEIADKFTRNAIMTSNEFRQVVGLKPSNDPDADALRNKNLNITSNPPADDSKTNNPISITEEQ